MYYLRAGALALYTINEAVESLFKMSFKKDYQFFQHMRAWSDRILKICGVELEVEGREFLKSGQSYVYVSNHASLMDIPVLVSGLRDNIRIIYKRELEKIPFMGWAMAKSPLIAINRADAKDAMESIDEAINAVKKGESVVVFAEGTRSKDGKLGDFKRGAFVLAARAEKPIVPVTIIGSNVVLPNGTLRFKKGKVVLKIHPPIENSSSLTRAEEKKLMEQVHTAVASSLK
jgi:1-acyl-sn-glycerol-3-phosphate acyltransferase